MKVTQTNKCKGYRMTNAFIRYLVLILVFLKKKKSVPGKPQTTKAEEVLPTSDFRLPISNFRLPTSNFRLLTSDF